MRMTVFEKHYSAVELAKLWGLHPKTIRNLFQDEPGVLVIERPEQMFKRGYTSLRIPASVADRVHERYSSKRSHRIAESL